MDKETKLKLMHHYKKIPGVKETLEIRDAYYKSIPKASLKQFEIHVTEHCNLNCRGCDNFSPLADANFIEVDWFDEQMKRMSELFLGYLGNVNILGGEPLLHPKINNILTIARKHFPHVEIDLLTNGLLLNSMGDDFYKTCRDCNIVISITKYPVIKTFDKIESRLNSSGVIWNYFNSDPLHHIYKTPIDLKGSCDGTRMFYKCFRAAHCVQLRDGRLYPCSVAPNMRFFIQKFDLKTVCEVEDDSIDVFKHTRKEILEFLSRPIPMCRFCDLDNFQIGIPFDRSKLVIEEWI